MADLRQSLNALVEHPPARPAPMDVVAARGARFVRRRQARRGAAGLLMVAIVAAGGLVVAQQGSEPRDVITADRGVPVAYTDNAGDAIGTAPQVAAYDIVRVAWAPAPSADDPRQGDYAISITITGVADEEGSYIASAELRSATADETCQISHYLMPGRTAFASVVCGSISKGTRRLVGRAEGGRVTSTPTSGGGTVLMATFDPSTLPLEAAGQAFVDLSAITACAESKPGCRLVYMDEARSKLTYRP